MGEDNRISNENLYRITLPLKLRWSPKEDITAYELALCMPYLFNLGGIMPSSIDEKLPHFRHFEIINPNK